MFNPCCSSSYIHAGCSSASNTITFSTCLLYRQWRIPHCQSRKLTAAYKLDNHVLPCFKTAKKLLSKGNSSKYKVGPVHSDGLEYTRGSVTQWESCPTITARNPVSTGEALFQTAPKTGFLMLSKSPRLKLIWNRLWLSARDNMLATKCWESKTGFFGWAHQ